MPEPMPAYLRVAFPQPDPEFRLLAAYESAPLREGLRERGILNPSAEDGFEALKRYFQEVGEPLPEGVELVTHEEFEARILRHAEQTTIEFVEDQA